MFFAITRCSTDCLRIPLLVCCVVCWAELTLALGLDSACGRLAGDSPVAAECSRHGKLLLQMALNEQVPSNVKSPTGQDSSMDLVAAQENSVVPMQRGHDLLPSTGKRQAEKNTVTEDGVEADATASMAYEGNVRSPLNFFQMGQEAESEEVQAMSDDVKPSMSRLAPLSVGLLPSILLCALWLTVFSRGKTQGNKNPPEQGSDSLDESETEEEVRQEPLPTSLPCVIKPPTVPNRPYRFAIPAMHHRDPRKSEIVFGVASWPDDDCTFAKGCPWDFMRVKISSKSIGSWAIKSQIELFDESSKIPLTSCSFTIDTENSNVQRALVSWLSLLWDEKGGSPKEATLMDATEGDTDDPQKHVILLAGAANTLVQSARTDATAPIDGWTLCAEFRDCLGETTGKLEAKPRNKYAVRIKDDVELTIEINLVEDWITLSKGGAVIAAAKGFGKQDLIQVELECDDFQLLPYLLVSMLAVIVFDLKIDAESGDAVFAGKHSEAQQSMSD